MIEFIDTNTGNIFNGSQPYQFWFDGGQSVNLNYVKSICVLSDQVTLTATIDSDDSFFCFLDTSSFGDPSQMVEMNQRKYYDLDNLKTMTITSTGTVVGMYYVHMFYILVNSPEAGEFHEIFTITDQSDNSEQFSICADFYNIDEVNQVNLSNLGIKIPTSIQKAIYDKNPYEEAPDSILLNRKMKELLVNYWDIIANKGSYKSLINSLDWFEYGDLLHIEEFWKHKETPQLSILEGKDINKSMSDELKRYITTKTKTTYLGVYLTLNKLLMENGKVEYEDSQGGEIIYRGLVGATVRALGNSERIPESSDSRVLQIGTNEAVNIEDWDPSSVIGWTGAQFQNILIEYGLVDPNDTHNEILNEQIPVLMQVLTKWNCVDLSIKMVLVGNFFSTYFMPIHLDLLHSTIDKLIFTTDLKILNTAAQHRVDRIETHNPIHLTMTSDYKLKPIEAYVYEDTLFSKDFGAYYQVGDSIHAEYCGVETKLRPLHRDISDPNNGLYQPSNIDVRTFADHMFGKIGCVVKFGCEIEDDGVILEEFLTWRNGTDPGDVFERRDNKIYQNIQGNVVIEFELLFQKASHYNLCLYFRSTSGHEYTRQIEFDILDDSRQKLSLYHIKKLPKDEFNDMFVSEYFYNKLNLPDHTFQQRLSERIPAWDQVSYGEQVQFLTTQENTDPDIIGLNHTLMIDLEYEYDRRFFDENSQSWMQDTIKIADYLMLEDSDGRMVNLNDPDLLNVLNNTFFDPNDNSTWYWWYIKDTWVDVGGVDENNQPFPPTVHPVLIGIRKAYTTEYGENKYKYGMERYRIKITPIIDPITHESTWIPSIRPGSTIIEDWNFVRESNQLRIVDEDRFYPILHTAEPLKDRFIDHSETIMCVPEFALSNPEAIESDDVVWEFYNISTGKSYFSKIYEYANFNGLYGDVVEQRVIKNHCATSGVFVDSFNSEQFDWLRDDVTNMLAPGYYNIKLHYLVSTNIPGLSIPDKNWQTVELNSAFRINK